MKRYITPIHLLYTVLHLIGIYAKYTTVYDQNFINLKCYVLYIYVQIYSYHRELHKSMTTILKLFIICSVLVKNMIYLINPCASRPLGYVHVYQARFISKLI